MRIVLCYPVESKHLAQIRSMAPDCEIIDAGQQRVAEELFTADIFCGHAKVPVDWDGVVRRGRLRWIQSSAAGMDHCLVPSVIDSEVVVTSASGVLADQVAEHTIALLTGWLRSLPAFFRAQQKKEFVRLPTADLHRSRIGIVGFGGVGRRLAQLLAPFRSRIVATDLFPVDKPDYVDALWPAERLDDLLASSDIVVLCLPLNEMTEGVLDAETLGRMKRGALLANMARGPLVEPEAMVDALRSGRLSGAVMDVTEPEPLPIDSPLWNMPNVIVTPHVGGQSATRIADMTDMFCENLRRWRDGRPLVNLLTDKRLGFPIRGTGHPLWVDICREVQGGVVE
jgi:phosphoglycerate dehydrogenase-like enzyme